MTYQIARDSYERRGREEHAVPDVEFTVRQAYLDDLSGLAGVIREVLEGETYLVGAGLSDQFAHVETLVARWTCPRPSEPTFKSDAAARPPMPPDEETLERRLEAVERALVDGDAPDGLADLAALNERVTRLETHLEELGRRLDELDAATQAIRGYVGNVRHVNRDIERRAAAALATAERVEAKLETDDSRATRGRGVDGTARSGE